VKIICFGDSVTRGVSFINNRLRILKKNYPNLLLDLFAKNQENASISQVDVVNKGVFNDNSDSLLARLDKDVLKENPSFVIIGIGGNDCNFLWQEVAKHPNDKHVATVPLDRYVQNLEYIILKIKQGDATPILLTLPPLDPVRYYSYISNLFGSQICDWICRVGGIEHWHGLYNRTVKKVAQELDIKLIDIRTAIKKAGDLANLISDDGIHPTEQGYKVIANEIYSEMISYIETKKSVTLGTYRC